MLEQHDVLDLLRNDLITIATQEIYSEGRTRREIQKDIKAKERAIEVLSSEYAKNGLSQEQIRQCLYSIGDNHAFLRVNRDPCDQMIVHLKQYFHPTQAKDPKNSLAIRSGRGGARLSHDHSKQYAYVLQSLTLWREILHGTFLLQMNNISLIDDRYVIQICSTSGLSPNKIYFQKMSPTASVIQVKVSIESKQHRKPRV